MLNAMIKRKEVPAFPKYTDESKADKLARRTSLQKEVRAGFWVLPGFRTATVAGSAPDLVAVRWQCCSPQQLAILQFEWRLNSMFHTNPLYLQYHPVPPMCRSP